MENKYPIKDMILPADKVAFIQDAIEKLKASNRSDYESGDFDISNHKQEARYKTFEEVLQWLNSKPAGPAWVTGQYDRLFDQLKAEPERKIVCWVDYQWRTRNSNGSFDTDICRDICAVMGRVMGFNARGIGYGGVELYIGEENEKDEFLNECECLHVRWLDEKEARP